MGISPESSIISTGCVNTAVNILIGVESEGSGFTSLLECGVESWVRGGPL